MKKLNFLGCFLGLFLSISASATDTLLLNLQQADSIFLQKNYLLLASSLNIEANKAQIIQAKLYPNPVLTLDFNTLDLENARVFHVGKTGQKIVQIEQLILLGGKRKLDIEMAKTNAAIAELEFQNLLRQLKFRLHRDLYSIGQQQFLLAKYTNQLAFLDTILQTYEAQTLKGNIPLKDLVRLKGAYLKLNNDRAELLKDYYELQVNLQTLLQVEDLVAFQFSEEEIAKYIKLNALADLKLEAIENNPELLLLKQDKRLAEQYLQYQRKQVVPDLNLIGSYDQRGGAFNNQISLGIAVPLPVWNRNQGNIQSAQIRLQEKELLAKAVQAELNSNLQNNFAIYTQTVTEYQKAVQLYNQDFEITLRGMTDNFQKRNISILEFLDFFESYNEVLTELMRIRIQLVTSAEHLNLLTGKENY